MDFGFSASYVAIWIVVLFQGLLIVALLRQLAELRRLVEAGGLQGEDRLPVGSPAPRFAGFDVRSGQPVSSHTFSGSGGLVLFLSADCTVCRGLADRLRPPAMNGLPPIIAFCQGGEHSCAGFVKKLSLDVHLLLEGAEETAARYRVSGFPTAVVVDANQKIRGYGHPRNVEDLRQLLARSLDAASADVHGDGKLSPAVLSSKVSR
jgi:hypothetical protein